MKINKHNAIDVNATDPNRIQDYNELLRMLTKIYNFESTSVITIIEDLDINQKHDLDLLNKVQELTNVFDQTNQQTVFKDYHDLLNECVQQL